MSSRRFQVFKQSVCGNQIRRVVETELTLSECRDLSRFPGGVHVDEIGKFTYGYCVMPNAHVEPERGSMRAKLAAEFLPDLKRGLRRA